MKKIIFLMMFAFVAGLLFAAGDEVPMQGMFEVGDRLWVSGYLAIANGRSPNLRLVTEKGEVAGIGGGDGLDSVPKALAAEIRKHRIPRGEFQLEYLRTTSLPYYELPLHCFQIVAYKDLIFPEY